jgi:hypothetical protein
MPAIAPNRRSAHGRHRGVAKRRERPQLRSAQSTTIHALVPR